MSYLRNYIDRAKSMPAHEVIRRILRLSVRKIRYWVNRKHDLRNGSFTGHDKIPHGKLYRYFPCFVPGRLDPTVSEQILSITNLYLSHRFDLLGSGWVQVKHGMKCRGLEGYRYEMSEEIVADTEGGWLKGRINTSNLRESQQIWRLVCKNHTLQDICYIPIDWHIDFKSGYRWREYTWYKDIRFGDKLGADVKVPWELARMQHLPMIAWAYALSSQDKKGFQPASIYVREFRNEILDFIATNPPRYGVNWCCTMDVGIRVSNWLVAYDMFRAFGAEFDHEFEVVLTNSVYQHGKHCLENLEYSQEFRSNHYLSDITGLLFAAAYLPETQETTCWFAFSVQELVSEMGFEFNADGSNFEASTSYHRLSAEIMLYSAILCLLLPIERLRAIKNYDHQRFRSLPPLRPYEKQEYNFDSATIFPDSFWERLEKAVEFTRDIIKPNGEIPQFGDNDSGRFLKIWPAYRMMQTREAILTYQNLTGYDELALNTIYPDETCLHHGHLVGVAGVLFNRADFISVAKPTPETEIIKAAFSGRKINSFRTYRVNTQSFAEGKCVGGSNKNIEIWLRELRKEMGDPILNEFTAQIDGAPLIKDLRIYAYSDFGLYLYRSPRCYLAIRCGSIGQKGNGGHAHNDQLGIELTLDGKDLIRDPGTYVYTCLPDRRNQFRSTLAHFVPQWHGQEQNSFPTGQEGLFSLKGKKPGECLHFSANGFVGRHDGFERPVYRVICIGKVNISIWDFGSAQHCEQVDYFSNGYGRWATACQQFRPVV